jgi:hypothetical protein
MRELRGGSVIVAVCACRRDRYGVQYHAAVELYWFSTEHVALLYFRLKGPDLSSLFYAHI